MPTSERGPRRARIWRRVLVIALFLTVGAVAAYQGGSSAPKAKRQVIAVRGFAFQPATVRVTIGDTVVWSNGDAVVHTATAADWKTGDIAGGSSAAIVMERRGIHEYICKYHPSMKGRLDVR